MNAELKPTPMTEETTCRGRGFSAPCIHCGEESVSVSLSDVAEFHCIECEADFTAEDVKKVLSQWSAVLKWIEAAPIK